MTQYIREKEGDYLRYGMETILSLVTQLHTWTVITNAKRMATKAAFIVPWSNSPDQHISTYTRDLRRRKNHAKEYDVKIINDNKFTQIVVCIYKATILEDSVMEKWEETGERNWANTIKHVAKEYGEVARTAERAAQRARFDSGAAFRENNRPRLPLENAPRPAVPIPFTEDYDAMNSYVKSLEQENHKPRSVGGRISKTTSLIDIPKTGASVIATNGTTAMMGEMI